MISVNLRKSGLDILGDVPWGTHVCQFYRTKDDLLDILVPYFKAGLENNEFCMWITSEPLEVEKAAEAMKLAVPGFDSYVSRGQIEILPYTEWYLKDGVFDSDRVLKGWVDKASRAIERGFDGLRLTGNTFWIEKAGWHDFTEYEEDVDNALGRYRIMAICTYSMDRCGPHEVIDVFRNHRSTLVKGESGWEKVDNPKHLMEKLHHFEMVAAQSNKMEALGQMSAGIAHDFKNILMAIETYAGILREKMHDKDLDGFVEKIQAASAKGEELTRGLLAFGRSQPSSPRAVDLNGIISRFGSFLMMLTGREIELRFELSERPLVVKADSLQIEQVLMNLAANSKDAMAQGGTLTIKTGYSESGVEPDRLDAVSGPGWAVITVSDTGNGIDEKTRSRIFEPFFTTKGSEKGTGLGLSIVYGIIRQHNGEIVCHSEVGKGTTFAIYLPLSEQAVKEEAVPKVRKTILVADDNEDVRELFKEFLEQNGYRVIEAVDGKEAINKFTECGNAVDLAVLDAIMPGKGGKEVYDEIRRVKKDIKALFISGRPSALLSEMGLITEGVDFISKPFFPSELLKKIRSLLG